MLPEGGILFLCLEKTSLECIKFDIDKINACKAGVFLV